MVTVVKEPPTIAASYFLIELTRCPALIRCYARNFTFYVLLLFAPFFLPTSYFLIRVPIGFALRPAAHNMKDAKNYSDVVVR